jgi:hypothetical protein
MFRALWITSILLTAGAGQVIFRLPAHDLIDEDRIIDWDPGVPGGIPTRSTACYTDSGGLDSVATLNTQIAACTTGQVVQLQAGTYTISSQIQISKGVSLRGASVDTTILNCTASWHCVQMGDFPSAPSGINVTASVAKDATTITVASTTGLAVNDYIAIDQLNDGTEVVNDDTAFGAAECRSAAGTRCLGQIVKITAINSLVLTVTPSIHHAYTTGALDPEVWEVTGVTTNAGIEDLTITRSNDPDGGYNNVKIVACSGCWVENVISDTPDDWHVDIDRAIWTEIRDSYFGFGTENTSGSAYGVVSNLFATDGLIENNIFEHLRHGMLVQNGATGNVYGYNYSFDCYQGEDWLATDINSHGSHTAFNLWEGNIGCKVYGDNAHGSSSYNTVYRNHVTRASTPSEGSQTNALRAVDIEAYNRYWNIVGNVLGTNGQTWDAYDPGTTRTASGGRYVYTFGYICDGAGSYLLAACTAGDDNPGTGDATIVDDTYVHGNYDDQSNSQIWDAGNSNHTLLDSLYLDAEPTFFSSGSCVYPPMVPSTGTVNTLPAQDRAGGGDGTCESAVYYTGLRSPANCTTATVQAEIDSAVDFDKVDIPGPCTITGTLTIPNTKGIWLDCNGATLTASTGVVMAPDASVSTRISHCTFTGTDDAIQISGPVQTWDRAPWRADHNTFTGTSGITIAISFARGVFDNNTVSGMTAAQEFLHHGDPGVSDGSGWTNVVTPGSNEAIYLEDNTFTTESGQANCSWIQGYYGSRMVIRYNTFNYTCIDNHGDAGQTGGGARWWELYLNTFVRAVGQNQSYAMSNRAGSGILYGNIISGETTQIGLCEESSGYPANFQIGRGQSQALFPAYGWDNDHAILVDACDAAAEPGMVAFNRDVYTDVDSASCTSGGSCTSGVGIGTTLPTSCTTNTGFWKTDAGGDWDTTHGGANDGALYKCTSTNTWTQYWVPVAYPSVLQTTLN